MGRSLRVALERRERVKLALRRQGFPSQTKLAQELGISRSTTDKFFTGGPVDFSYFVEICQKLGLDWQDVADIEEAFPTESEPLPPTETDFINWRQVCVAMLEAQHQRRLTTNPLTVGDGMAFALSEIYVPLGLVERQQRDKRMGDFSPEVGSLFYEPDAQDEVIQTFQNEQFFEQVLSQGHSKRIAIIGEPGAGKTTLLQKIAAWVLDNTSDVPIWVSLADLQGKSLEQYLLQDWLKTATRKVRVTEAMEEALGELFNSGRVWLLLDGVDEMTFVETPNFAPLQWVASQLQGWIADARVVLTCRLNVWDAGKNALETFDTYRNLDFSYGEGQTADQVGQFIRCWFKDNPQLGERLRVELDEPGRERIKDAVKNPLRLVLLCRSWMLGQGGLPSTKAGLYQQFTEALYEWKQDRFPTTYTQRQRLNHKLGELALRAIASEKTKFRLRHRLVCEVLGEPDSEWFELALQLGWLNQVGIAAEAENRGETVYAFFHPTFQEYLAALAVEDWHFFLDHKPQNPAQGTYHIFEPQWKEVILLWFGREDVPKEQKEEFIKALVEFEDGCWYCYRYRAYFLAAEGIAEFRDCSLGDAIATQLTQWICGNFEIEEYTWLRGCHPTATQVCVALLHTDCQKSIKTLTHQLRTSQDDQICLQMATILEDIAPGNAEAIATLIHLLDNSQQERIRWQACESLGQIGMGNSKAINALIRLVYTSQDDSLRWLAVEGLGQIGTGNSKVITVLKSLLHQDYEDSIRWRAAESLGKIDPGNPEAIAVLIDLLQTSKNTSTRCYALESLEKIGIGNTEAIKVLIHLLNTTRNKDILRLAIKSLGKIATGNTEVIPPLLRLLDTTQERAILWQIVQSLKNIAPGNTDASKALLHLLNSSSDEGIRQGVAWGLGLIASPGNTETIAALIHLLHTSTDEAMLKRAAKSLGEIATGNQDVINALIYLLRTHQNEYILCTAAESLGQINPGNSEALNSLIELLLTSSKEQVCRQAASSLRLILKDSLFSIVIFRLKDCLHNKQSIRYIPCYNLIWHCTQNMTYPEFYQAWHSQPQISNSFS